MRLIATLVAALAVALLTTAAMAGRDRAEPVPAVRVQAHPQRQCRSARVALRFYRLQHAYWQQLRGASALRAGDPQGCAHLRWAAVLWKQRAQAAREAYYRWRETRRTLHEGWWGKAIAEVQRPYPGTRGWLWSCSGSEGGHGLWVPNKQGSGAGGWLQFLSGTFWRMFSSAKADVESRGFKVPASAASWYSPLGQALAGAWGVTHGRSGEWYGGGC